VSQSRAPGQGRRSRRCSQRLGCEIKFGSACSWQRKTRRGGGEERLPSATSSRLGEIEYPYFDEFSFAATIESTKPMTEMTAEVVSCSQRREHRFSQSERSFSQRREREKPTDSAGKVSEGILVEREAHHAHAAPSSSQTLDLAEHLEAGFVPTEEGGEYCDRGCRGVSGSKTEGNGRQSDEGVRATTDRS
jgi:hypothetical protein